MKSVTVSVLWTVSVSVMVWRSIASVTYHKESVGEQFTLVSVVVMTSVIVCSIVLVLSITSVETYTLVIVVGWTTVRVFSTVMKSVIV
jgi:hypothetical protein